MSYRKTIYECVHCDVKRTVEFESDFKPQSPKCKYCGRVMKTDEEIKASKKTTKGERATVRE